MQQAESMARAFRVAGQSAHTLGTVYNGAPDNTHPVCLETQALKWVVTWCAGSQVLLGRGIQPSPTAPVPIAQHC